MSNFRMEGEKIFSEVTGDLVATIENGSVKMVAGKNAMTPKVKEFWEMVKSGDIAVDPDPGICAETAIEEFPVEEEEEEVNTHYLEEELNRDHVVYGDAPRMGTSAPKSEEKKEKQKSAKELMIWDIPEDELPAFSAALGVSTPEFKAFVKKHKLNKEQIAELVRRVERRK